MKTYLSFTDLDQKGAEDYVAAHKDQIEAAGGSLDMAMGSAVILRLMLPDDSVAEPANVLPDQTWMPVIGLNVPIQRTDFDIEQEEREHGGVE